VLAFVAAVAAQVLLGQPEQIMLEEMAAMGLLLFYQVHQLTMLVVAEVVH